MELNERLVEAAILKELERDQVPVTIFLTNGLGLQGVIVRQDVLVIVLVSDGVQKIVYKHSISSINPHSPLRAAQPRK